MFTGIVEELGRVRSLAEAGDLVVRSRIAASDAAVGDSISIGGVCLTVVGRDGDDLSFDISRGDASNGRAWGRLAPGDPVNVERPATLASRLGGHLVQGHVDGVAEVEAVRAGRGDGARLSVRLPDDLLRSSSRRGRSRSTA